MSKYNLEVPFHRFQRQSLQALKDHLQESAPDQLHFADLQSAHQTLHGSRTGTPEQVPSGSSCHQDSLSGSHHPRHLRSGVQIPNQVPNPLWFRPCQGIRQTRITQSGSPE